jgi:hypothetical protein
LLNKLSHQRAFTEKEQLIFEVPEMRTPNAEISSESFEKSTGLRRFSVPGVCEHVKGLRQRMRSRPYEMHIEIGESNC